MVAFICPVWSFRDSIENLYWSMFFMFVICVFRVIFLLRSFRVICEIVFRGGWRVFVRIKSVKIPRIVIVKEIFRRFMLLLVFIG